ncbi:MAG: sigma-54-dependent Fis family transcriptional regulator [Magnetococcales bacterium]|nr:sigma-54-dependent Fis family transcriptional regulator [Magnetococcales bacterium]
MSVTLPLPCRSETDSPQVHGISPTSTNPGSVGMVGISPAFNRMMELVMRVATERTTVLLLGESGTGKELVARAIHDVGRRSGRPFVVVECSGLTETLFESELFGHIKGAFTGACADKSGLVETAHQGTLFLDEVGEIPLALQVKLLRLLETGTYRKVGSTEARHADFRLICATNRDLATMVEQGGFRKDLFYRISIFPILMPPLRERLEDIPLLAETLLKRLAGGKNLTLSWEALTKLIEHPFPGNIRELQNLLERARILAAGDCLLPEHFPGLEPGEGGSAGLRLPWVPSLSRSACPVVSVEAGLSLKAVELRYIDRMQATFPGTRRELARLMGVSVRTLLRKIKEAVAARRETGCGPPGRVGQPQRWNGVTH